MKKDKIKVYFDVDNKWEMDVFYLKENLMPENFALGDVGLEQPISEKEMWDKVGPHAEAKFLNDLDVIIGDCKGSDLADDDWDDPLADELPTLDSLCGNEMDVNEMDVNEMDVNEMDVNENSAGMGYVCNDEGEVIEIKGCCPVGPKGQSGPRGIDEERMYPLILDSLRKFSECEVDLSKDSACEVLADGITKKIIKYMWGKE